MRPRDSKILHDVRGAYGRVAVMTIAIAVAVMGFGAILIAKEVITSDAQAAYAATNPAAATIDVASGVDEQLLADVRQIDGVLDAAARQTVSTTVQLDGEWIPLRVFVVDPSDSRTIAAFADPDEVWPAGTGGVVLERAAASLLGVRAGDTLTVASATGEEAALSVDGAVWDAALAPATRERTGYAFATPQTVAALGFPVLADQLLITVDDGRGSQSRNPDRVDEVAATIATRLQQMGSEVHGVTAPPYRHPHQNQTDTVTNLLLGFAIAALALAGVLVASTLGGMLAGQAREIAIMKTVGATTGAVARLYLGMVAAIAIVATGVALPGAIAGGLGLARLVGGLLNIDIVATGATPGTTAVVILSGVLVPVVVAMVPVLRAAGLSVREALGGLSISAASRLSQLLGRVGGGNRLPVFALRNLARRPRRLASTVALLALGGSLFLAGLNSAAAWEGWVDDGLSRRSYDAQLTLSEPMAAADAAAALGGVDGIASWEGLLSLPAVPAGERGDVVIERVYPDGGHGTFLATALDPQTEYLDLAVRDGRWLRADDTDAVVLNQSAATRLDDPTVGSTVHLSVEGSLVTARVVGVVNEVGGGANAYFPSGALDDVVGISDTLNGVRLVASAPLADVTQRAEDALGSVVSVVPTAELRSAIDQHVVVFIAVLIALAIVMAVIGALGLASAMTISVMERTREFGVMKATGARPGTIRLLVVLEGLATGAFGLAVALVLSVPASALVGSTLGRLAFNLPLPLVITAGPIGVWALVAVLGAALASLSAAQRGARLTVLESLAHQ